MNRNDQQFQKRYLEDNVSFVQLKPTISNVLSSQTSPGHSRQTSHVKGNSLDWKKLRGSQQNKDQKFEKVQSPQQPQSLSKTDNKSYLPYDPVLMQQTLKRKIEDRETKYQESTAKFQKVPSVFVEQVKLQTITHYEHDHHISVWSSRPATPHKVQSQHPYVDTTPKYDHKSSVSSLPPPPSSDKGISAPATLAGIDQTRDLHAQVETQPAKLFVDRSIQVSDSSLVRCRDYGTRVQSQQSLSNVHSIEGLDKRVLPETTPTLKSTKQHPAFKVFQNPKADDTTYIAKAFTLEQEMPSKVLSISSIDHGSASSGKTHNFSKLLSIQKEQGILLQTLLNKPRDTQTELVLSQMQQMFQKMQLIEEKLGRKEHFQEVSQISRNRLESISEEEVEKPQLFTLCQGSQQHSTESITPSKLASWLTTELQQVKADSAKQINKLHQSYKAELERMKGDTNVVQQLRQAEFQRDLLERKLIKVQKQAAKKAESKREPESANITIGNTTYERNVLGDVSNLCSHKSSNRSKPKYKKVKTKVEQSVESSLLAKEREISMRIDRIQSVLDDN